MKMALTIIFLTAIVFYIGKTSINFSPFKITMEKPTEVFGFVFLVLALGCFRYQAHTDGFNKGIEKSIEQIRKAK